MGCGASAPAPQGVPIRVDLPVSDGDAPDGVAWQSGTIIKTLANGMCEMRIDNMPPGPPMMVRLKPDVGFGDESFERFNEDGEEGHDNEEAVGKKLPTNPGDRLFVEMEDGKKLRGRVGMDFRYAAGEKLLVMTEGAMLDATVVKPVDSFSTKHQIKLSSGRTIKLDLNEYNHCKQTFGNAAVRCCRRGAAGRAGGASHGRGTS